MAPGVRRRFDLISAHTVAMLLLLLLLTMTMTVVTAALTGATRYTNQFAVRVAGGDHGQADRVARRHGFVNRGQVSVVCFIPDGIITIVYIILLYLSMDWFIRNFQQVDRF